MSRHSAQRDESAAVASPSAECAVPGSRSRSRRARGGAVPAPSSRVSRLELDASSSTVSTRGDRTLRSQDESCSSRNYSINRL